MSAVLSQSNEFSIVARRNCSMSPRALLAFFLVTAVLSLLIAMAWAMFIVYAWRLMRNYSDELAKKTFRFSLWHLSLLFAALLVDHYIPL